MRPGMGVEAIANVEKSPSEVERTVQRLNHRFHKPRF